MPKRGVGALTTVLCLLVATFEGLDLQAAGVVAPRLASLFHPAADQLGWFFSASTFGLLVGAAVGGRISDRIGRKPTLVMSVVIFGLFSAASAFAPDFHILIAARFLTGLGLGGALPNMIALAAENAPPGRRKRAVAFMYCGMPAGGVLASLIMLLSRGGDDWKHVFLAGGLAPLLLAPLLGLLLPESREFAAHRRTPGEAETEGLVREKAVNIFADGGVVSTLLLWISFFCALLVLYLLLNWLPTLLVSRGLTKQEASAVQMAFNLAGILGALTGGLMDGRRRALVVIGVFSTLAAGLAFLASAPPGLALALVAGSVIGASVLGTQGILYALAPSLYPTRVRGAGVGSAVAVGRIGSALGPMATGVLITGGMSTGAVLTALLPLVALSGLCALGLLGRGRADV